MFLDQVWDGIKTGSLACLCAFGIYCMVVGAIITVDQLAAHITAGCEKGGQQCRVEPEPAGTNAPRSPILTIQLPHIRPTSQRLASFTATTPLLLS